MSDKPMDLARPSDDRTGDLPAAGLTPRHRLDALLEAGWRRKWLIVLAAALIGGAASWWIHRLPDRYRSEALLLVLPQQIPESFVRPTVTTRSDRRLQSITQQILSRTQLEQIVKDFDLYADRRETETMQDIVDSMRTRDIEVRPDKGEAFRLGFSAGSPDVAKRVAERLVSLFIVETSLDRASLAEGTDQFLEAQLETARRRLIDNEATLEEYRRRHTGELPSQLEANVRGLNNTETQMQVLAESLNRDRDRHLMLERSIKDASLDGLLATGSQGLSLNATTQNAAEQLERAEADFAAMRSTLTDQHPDVVAMSHTIADLRTRVDAERAQGGGRGQAAVAERIRRDRLEDLKAELSSIGSQMAQKVEERNRLRGLLDKYQRRIEAAPMREAELAALMRDYETLQQAYRALLAKKQESAMAASLERQQTDAHFKVLDPPRLPERPFAPRRARLHALAALAGLAIGLLCAALFEWLDRGLRTAEDVHAVLGLAVLAAIPRVSGPHPRGRRVAAIVSVGTAIAATVAALAWHSWQ